MRHRKTVVSKSDTVWNVNLNQPTRSLKGILLLFTENAPYALYAPYAVDSEAQFYNPGITKVEVTVEGQPNQLFASSMRAIDMWEEALKYFGSGAPKRSRLAGHMSKEFRLTDTTLRSYLAGGRYGLWMDFRTTDDNSCHGTGRRIENVAEGVTLQITKFAQAAGALNMYVYCVQDAQLNIEWGQFFAAVY